MARCGGNNMQTKNCRQISQFSPNKKKINLRIVSVSLKTHGLHKIFYVFMIWKQTNYPVKEKDIILFRKYHLHPNFAMKMYLTVIYTHDRVDISYALCFG